jgi:sugar lactone lactonase YvrE
VSQVPGALALIQLPAGFGPEGIAAGSGSTFYVGSLTSPTLGQILAGDFLTGALSQLVAPSGRQASGLKHDRRSNLLFVAGGTSGRGTVYDAGSGKEVVAYQFQPSSAPAPAVPTTAINDVVITPGAAYFTDSIQPLLYRVALNVDGVPAQAATSILLPVEFGVPGGCTVSPPNGGNGIAADPAGLHLLIVHMSRGQLYRVDTATNGVAPIALQGGDGVGGGPVCAADGMLLEGNRLYVVQNFLNRVAVVELAANRLSGNITRYITEPFASNPSLKVPATIAPFDAFLYAVTAGFAPPSPDFVVRLAK